MRADMQEPRFDRRAILRALLVIVGGTALAALLVPVAGALIDGDGPLTTENVSGHTIYQWGIWVLAWGLTIWQGAWMLRTVGEKIIDDMLVTGILAAVLLVVVKVVVWIIYWPLDSTGTRLAPITPIDVGGALLMLVVAVIAARVNRY